jgi:hypothetical protein
MWPNTGHGNPQESNDYSLMGAERTVCFFCAFCVHSKIPLCPPLEKGDKANPKPPFVKGGRGDFAQVTEWARSRICLGHLLNED